MGNREGNQDVGRLGANAPTALAPPSGVKPASGLEQSRSSHGAVTPIDRLRKIMRRFRDRDERNDRGPWRGMGEISQAHGGSKDEVRGLLIELVASGEVDASVCSNGTFWCAGRL